MNSGKRATITKINSSFNYCRLTKVTYIIPESLAARFFEIKTK